MLELRDAESAFERVDDYLRDAGFFDGGARGLCADLFLGYGLSAAIRRQRRSGPVEPCRLPLAACRIRSVEEPGPEPCGFEIGDWQATWDETDYAAAVEAAKAAIARGDNMQYAGVISPQVSPAASPSRNRPRYQSSDASPVK